MSFLRSERSVLQNTLLYINEWFAVNSSKGLFTNYVSQKWGGPGPPSPLRQPLSAFPKPPLPPVSAVSICPTLPTFSASVLGTYLKPPHPEYPIFWGEESTYVDKIY